MGVHFQALTGIGDVSSPGDDIADIIGLGGRQCRNRSNLGRDHDFILLLAEDAGAPAARIHEALIVIAGVAAGFVISDSDGWRAAGLPVD